MSYVEISEGIVNLLDTIPEIAAVYDHEPKELKSYPCVTVSAFEHDNEFHDLAANKRRYSFLIRAYFRTDNAQDAETVLRTIADNIVSTIESNIRLQNSCDFASPTKARWGYVEREVPVRYVEITIDAFKRVLR